MDAPPVVKIDLGQVIMPLDLSSVDRLGWSFSGATGVYRLARKGDKGAWLFSANAHLDWIPTDVEDVDLSQGAVTVLVLRGHLTVGTTRYKSYSLVGLDLARFMEADDIPAIGATTGSLLLVLYAGAKGEEADPTGSLRLNLNDLLGGFILRDAVLTRAVPSQGRVLLVKDIYPAAQLHVQKVNRGAPINPHVHGPGGEVSIVLGGARGCVTNESGPPLEGGDLVIYGRGTHHRLSVSDPVVWCTASYGSPPERP